MAVVDTGGPGDPVVFLHGNPTSSYLWRNVVPHLTPVARCIVPDLIGMGDSEPLSNSGPDRYRFVEHREYLDQLLAAMNVDNRVTFVGHDWGGALGFDWANRHRESVLGLAYMEAVVCPLSWDDWPEGAKRVFQGFRSSAGDEMILEKNMFVERVLPSAILRRFSEEEMAEYRRPFTEPGERRRPMLTWPREIPFDGEPGDVHRIVSDYAAWLAQTTLPKLFINADPGSILIGRQRELCRTWPNQREVTVRGSHFIQEDSADEIGTALADWYREISR